MNVKDLFIQVINQIPEPILEEILDFLRFLKAKQNQDKLAAALLSESTLKKDWLRPEEDEAWRDL